MRRRRQVALLTFVVALAVTASMAGTAATASTTPRSCSSYPTPGTIAAAGTRTPPQLVAEYDVLGHRQHSVDRLRPGQLGKGLSASGIVMSGIRFLAATPSGALVYLVPADHYLAFRIAPDRCLSPRERGIEDSLRPYLEGEYAHRALCLLTLSAGHATSTCSAAPATVDPLLVGPRNPGFGLAPNGVSRVLVHYNQEPSLAIRVHRNFWVVNTASSSGAAPCGVDWLHGETVLRIVKSCTSLVDTT
jgi:hypothetical protein